MLFTSALSYAVSVKTVKYRNCYRFLRLFHHAVSWRPGRNLPAYFQIFRDEGFDMGAHHPQHDQRVEHVSAAEFLLLPLMNRWRNPPKSMELTTPIS